MSDLSPQEFERMLELLADRATSALSPEDEADLSDLLGRADQDVADQHSTLIASLILAMDNPAEAGMPQDVRSRLQNRGALLMGDVRPGRSVKAQGHRAPWIAAAASVLVCGVLVGLLAILLQQRSATLQAAQQEITALSERTEANDRLLAQARSRAALLTGQAAEAARRETELVQQLANAATELDTARLEIARYERPDDPQQLKADRRLLVSLDDTVVVPWQPFDLPDAPAEQQGVRGDVAWNDELQTGYLRFVGLKINDPRSEQYQVWVIDERGMEQKISGGVFNATLEGEVIVPIQPGIDVGRAALFAITIENPGGTWVPDLARRVVVGPRGEG